MSIRARAVRREFDGKVAIEHADVDVAPGVITGLIGPNGSGKTTLLLVLAGLLAPDSGSVDVDGADPATDGPAARARIGWMPDHVGTWETMTAHEIVAAFGRIYGLDRATANSRATDLLAEVGLSEFAGSRARVLSRGQKQRLCIARALLKKPKILILDDSTSAVDTATDAKIRRSFAEKIPGTTVFIIAQRISSVENADHVLVLDNGKVSGYGTPAEMLATNAIYQEVYASQTKGSGDFDQKGGDQ